MEYSSTLFRRAAAALQAGEPGRARQDCARFVGQLEKLRPLDLLEFGQYPLPSSEKPSGLDVRAPILWLVLARQGSRLLLLSQRCLDWEFFDGSGPLFAPCFAADWPSSYVRKYLNQECFARWFSPAQQAVIAPVRLENPASPLTSGPELPPTEDRLFLPSWEELAQWEDRLPTSDWRPACLLLVDQDAPEEGIQISREPCSWWLRTGGPRAGDVAAVEKDGSVNLTGKDAGCDEMGLRPALWLDLDRIARLPELLPPEQL